MYTKKEVVEKMLRDKPGALQTEGRAFAPANIALCKYWGKRDEELNLPLTSSLSISLSDKGAETVIRPSDRDHYTSDGQTMSPQSSFGSRLCAYLDLFRSPPCPYFEVKTTNTIPVAAGLASSASGYAALVLALNQLSGWNLSGKECSILARMGSGSAARSVYHGFVEWHAGREPEGEDSYAERLSVEWPDFRIGILTLSEKKKPISSRAAMRQTVQTSTLYEKWPEQVARDMTALKQALHDRDFLALGEAAEHNALSMHATMFATKPPVCYWQPETVATLQKIWALRNEGLPLFATMDAGPNVKMLFQEDDALTVQTHFPTIQIVSPFSD